MARTFRTPFSLFAAHLQFDSSMLALLTRCVVLIGSFAIYLQPCASLVLPGESSSFASVSANSAIPSPTGLFANDTVTWIAPKCVGNPDWMGGGIIGYDCRHLVTRFYSAILPQFDRMYEFVAAESHSIAPPDALILPLKYAYRELTGIRRCRKIS